MKPLRVLYFIDSLGSGGAQRQLVTLVRALDRAAVEPTVAVYHPLYHFRPELAEAGIRIVNLGPGGGRNPRVLLRLTALLKRGGFDLVHSYMRAPSVLARVASSLIFGPPVIVSERNVDLGQARGAITLERMLAGRAAAMIVNAEAIRVHVERLVPAWRKMIKVIPNGVAWSEPTDAERRKAGEFRRSHLGGAEILLGVVARIEWQKAPDILLHALELLPDEVCGRIRVVWVGKTIDRELVLLIRRRLEDSPLAGRVSFIPETRDVRSVYLGIDGLVLPSRWEGFPNVVLEALAHGVPVIATDVGDVRKLVEPGTSGWVVPTGDAGALASAIRDLVGSPTALREQMGRVGSSFVLSEYSVERLVERTMIVYRYVLGTA